MSSRRRSGMGLGAPNTAAAISTGSAAVGAGVAAGSAIAAGAAIGSVVPLVGTAIGALAGLGVALFSGGGTIDQLKNVWDVVPFSLLRLSGGHGTWTDPLTHAVFTDAGSDLRKSAVVASSIGAFNDLNNFWYDKVTQQHLTPADTWQRWQQTFGNASFAQAYAAAPSAFAIFNPTDASGDPQIHAPGAVVAAPSTAPVPVSTVGSLAPAGSVPAPQTASVLGGLSSTTLAIVGGGLLVGAILMRRRGRT